ncbi:MAG: RecA-superfamily ATPase [Candidatus Alkanophagales archaeon MCA70_species_1]|nr:RecA-superfamily ATPase [Candidatus Alkanophaga volatiphilum]
MKEKLIPTGILSLDTVLGGGLPAGAFVLLLGEDGAGHQEFAYTSALMLSQLIESPELAAGGGTKLLPEKIYYISLTRAVEDVFNELKMSFSFAAGTAFEKNIRFLDFSREYFRRSIVPYSWLSREFSVEEVEKLMAGERDLLSALTAGLGEIKDERCVVIFDSLTALATCPEVEWENLLAFLRGVQRALKLNEGARLLYGLLTKDVLGRSCEEAISDCADAVFVFKWEAFGTTQRRREMYVRKLRGLMPRLESEGIANFEVRITSRGGFEISKIKEVLGR